jgi:hypothetical protein
MRAARAAKREQRLAEDARTAERREALDRPVGSSPDAPTATAARASDTTAAPDHTVCEAIVDALRTELVNLEERYDDLVLARWILSRKYEQALGRMRSHDPTVFVWLVEHLAERER